MLATRTIDDVVQLLPVLPELSIRRVTSARVMAAIQERDVQAMEARFAQGHRAYVAEYNGWPAAFGWVATRSAEIGELQFAFNIPEGERYLWNFVTLKAFRGLGIYPRLLQHILAAETRLAAERFWIAYAPENHASGAGILKAGFTTVAQLSFDMLGQAAISEVTPGGAELASRLLGINEVRDDLTDCWKCVRMGGGCNSTPCCCDYQKPEQNCAA